MMKGTKGMIRIGLALGLLATMPGCGDKKSANAGPADVHKACESLVRQSTKDKAAFLDACAKVDPQVVSCVATAKGGGGSKGDSCDKLHDTVPKDTWMGLMLGQLGQ